MDIWATRVSLRVVDVKVWKVVMGKVLQCEFKRFIWSRDYKHEKLDISPFSYEDGFICTVGLIILGFGFALASMSTNIENNSGNSWKRSPAPRVTITWLGTVEWSRPFALPRQLGQPGYVGMDILSIHYYTRFRYQGTRSRTFCKHLTPSRDVTEGCEKKWLFFRTMADRWQANWGEFYLREYHVTENDPGRATALYVDPICDDI